MPLDHHGRAIVSAIPVCIKKEIPYIGEYLDSRFISTNQLKKVNREKQKKLKEDPDSIEDGFYVDCIDLQPDQDTLRSTIFEDSPSSAEVEVEVLDLPDIIYPGSQIGLELMQVLSSLDENEILAHDSLRCII